MVNKNSLAYKPVKGKLKTRWTDSIQPHNVLPEYPRPQMVREKWMNLNGLWDYAIRPIGEPIDQYDGEILVPFPLESSLSGVGKPLQPNEILWYRTTFNLPKEIEKNRILLHFGAVDWKMELWINDNKVGMHTGGFYPFHFEISDYIVSGENEIIISVWDPTDSENQERGKQTLHPKGIFYTAISGIWQTVWLEPVPRQYITSFKLTPNIDEETLTVAIQTNENNSKHTFRATVLKSGEIIVIGETNIGESLKLHIPNPDLWSPDAPNLYDLKIELITKDVIDSVDSYFGMRKFSIERDKDGLKRLHLNNEPLFQHGILDQGYWPDGLYTAPTDEALEYDVIAAKKLGFNMIRKHIKVEAARWYYHCDRLGMIVWQDMINGGSGWNHLHHLILPNLFRSLHVKDNIEKTYKALGREHEANRQNFKKELKEMIDALYNMTSIAMWVPFNEAWGQFNAEEIYNWVTSYDPTRYVDHASGWHDQRVGEIKSVHIYFRKLAMPKHINDRTVLITEYGGYSLPIKGHVWKEDKSFGYRKFKTDHDLFRAYSSLMNDQLKPLIDKGVSAAVYTQLTDVEEEVNGLLTYDREIIKLNSSKLKELHKTIIENSIEEKQMTTKGNQKDEG